MKKSAFFPSQRLWHVLSALVIFTLGSLVIFIVIQGDAFKPQQPTIPSEHIRERSIWNQYIKAQDRATDEGNTKYPEPELGAGFDKDEYMEFMTIKYGYIDELREKYENDVATRNNITYQELKDIARMGMKEEWEFPPL